MFNEPHWTWMAHPAHFICAKDCKFHLATEVGGYVVSTIGELWPDSAVRKINADVRGVNIKGKGDEWDNNYFKKFGWDEIGYNRKYETMVFKSKPNKLAKCCPFEAYFGGEGELDMSGYNSADDAYTGHFELCKKWSNKNFF